MREESPQAVIRLVHAALADTAERIAA
jgi:hypothetical protein